MKFTTLKLSLALKLAVDLTFCGGRWESAKMQLVPRVSGL